MLSFTGNQSLIRILGFPQSVLQYFISEVGREGKGREGDRKEDSKMEGEGEHEEETMQMEQIKGKTIACNRIKFRLATNVFLTLIKSK